RPTHHAVVDVRHLRAVVAAVMDRAPPAASGARRTTCGRLTAMASTRRREYLQALGIELWLPRGPGVAAEHPPPAAPSTAAGQAAESAATAATAETARPAELARTAAALGTTAPHLPAPHTTHAGAEPGSGGDAAAQWAELRTEVLKCTRCPLHATRTQGVLGVGPPRADWLVIGEAPGAEEDRRGEPF